MSVTGQVRWGIIGTARIARKAFLPAVAAAGGVVTGSGRPGAGPGQRVRRGDGIGRPVQGYQALVDDPDVDALYIPLPNGLHAEWTIRALRAGKAVLCEKPLCGTLAETEQVLAVARETGPRSGRRSCSLSTSRWRRSAGCSPTGIGELREIQSNFHFVLNQPDDIRLRRGLAGGALNDVGCYPVRLAVELLTASWSRPGPPRSSAGTGWTSTCRAASVTRATSG